MNPESAAVFHFRLCCAERCAGAFRAATIDLAAIAFEQPGREFPANSKLARHEADFAMAIGFHKAGDKIHDSHGRRLPILDATPIPIAFEESFGGRLSMRNYFFAASCDERLFGMGDAQCEMEHQGFPSESDLMDASLQALKLAATHAIEELGGQQAAFFHEKRSIERAPPAQPGLPWAHRGDAWSACIDAALEVDAMGRSLAEARSIASLVEKPACAKSRIGRL